MGILWKFNRAAHPEWEGMQTDMKSRFPFGRWNPKRSKTCLCHDVLSFGLRFPCCFLPGVGLFQIVLRDFFFRLLVVGGSFRPGPLADFIHRTLPPDTVVGLFGDDRGAV